MKYPIGEDVMREVDGVEYRLRSPESEGLIPEYTWGPVVEILAMGPHVIWKYRRDARNLHPALVAIREHGVLEYTLSGGHGASYRTLEEAMIASIGVHDQGRPYSFELIDFILKGLGVTPEPIWGNALGPWVDVEKSGDE